MPAPASKASTVTLERGQQDTLVPLWKDRDGNRVDVENVDQQGNQVDWTVVPPIGIITLEPDTSGPGLGGTRATITAVGLGTCTVTATLSGGLISAEIHVQVISHDPVQGEIEVKE